MHDVARHVAMLRSMYQVDFELKPASVLRPSDETTDSRHSVFLKYDKKKTEIMTKSVTFQKNNVQDGLYAECLLLHVMQ